MGSERTILCGNAEAGDLKSKGDGLLRLHLYGPRSPDKITLEIEDIRHSIYRDVPARLHDLLDIATYVFAADQAVPRGTQDVETFGGNWRRTLRFVIPVNDVEFWSSDEARKQLEITLSFLSDDSYQFYFVKIKDRPGLQQFLTFDDSGEMLGRPEQVVMFSGGLDSLGGAVDEIINQKRRLILVNHRPTPKLDRRYGALLDLLNEKAPNNPPMHVRVTVHKQKWMNKEYTQRTRSFLFAVLGATIASMLNQTSLRFYENGVVSMNLPVCAQVVGGKATRTTHPRVLDAFQRLLALVTSGPFIVENPFLWKTKGEVVKLIVDAGCTEMIGPSFSCTHVWEMTKEHLHCGTCAQCIDRRFAVSAAGADAHDPLRHYAVDVFTQVRRAVNDRQIDKLREDKTLFASYLERANQASRLPTATQFLSRFPEVTRAIPHLAGDPGANAQRLLDLYKRHSEEVNGVIDRMVATHARAIRERTLSPDAMVRVVCESFLPTSVPAVVPSGDLPKNVFRRNGHAWQACFAGQEPFTILPWLGASYLHRLVAAPHERIPAQDIVLDSAIDHCRHAISTREAIDEGLESAANPLLAGIGKIGDLQSLREYMSKASELRAAIGKAREDNDTALERQYDQDHAAIVSQINQTLGMGGRLKSAADKRKNIRDSLRNAVKRLISDQIKDTHPAMAEHLLKWLKFGNDPCYAPEPRIEWETAPVKND